ncbi:unknown (plasmid) [Haloarcula marismortui ATCC 43049]|uniref:Uncharacterized protein n=1 Tax=Haloarcula marismortui (strain ATCC 43049 / DSM 3752 / JCM 8966 / VKM B-1809) TaxID=272569 RepID=Q5V817_HALMA|nr:unknown [Haloarcula marismortui ATCC 43049]
MTTATSARSVARIAPTPDASGTTNVARPARASERTSLAISFHLEQRSGGSPLPFLFLIRARTQRTFWSTQADWCRSARQPGHRRRLSST